jgi:hypothetical protein
VKVTLSSLGASGYRVVVDRVQVGLVLGRYADWYAELWPVPGRRLHGRPVDTFTRPRLVDVRAELGRRLTYVGPWWTAAAEEAS